MTIKLPEGIITRRSIGACFGCDRSNQVAFTGWIRYALREGQVVTIPGLDKELTNFGCWTDVCAGCYLDGRTEVASFDHPDNWGYPGWDTYRAAGHGTEVRGIIAAARIEYDALFPQSN